MTLPTNVFNTGTKLQSVGVTE